MNAKVGILVVHGIGVQEPGFADDFIEKMEEQLADLGIAPDEVEWERAFWADLLTFRENRLWADLSRNSDLDWVSVRKFIINVLADAIAYQRVPGKQDDMYRNIHGRIHEHLGKLRTALGSQDRPLVVIAHSLGSVILSNYIWDEQSGKGPGQNRFERMETLAGMVTFGSNIPLFSLALDQADIKSFEFPPAGLPANLIPRAKWLNFFDADDVLGYPLKPLSPSYDKAVTEDREINVGNLFTSWNPISHTEYWSDGDFIKPVAQLIGDIAKA